MRFLLTRSCAIAALMLLLLGSLATAAAAQDSDTDPDADPTPSGEVDEPTPEPEPEPEPSPDPDPTPSDDAEADDDPADDAAADGDADSENEDEAEGEEAEDDEEEEDEEPEPRCGPDEVDLGPSEADAQCISKAELSRLLGDFESAAAEEATALGELSDVLETLDALEADLVALNERLAVVQTRHAAAEVDARFATMRAEIAGESLEDVSVALSEEESKFEEQAIEAYIGGDARELEVTTGAIASTSNEVETAQQYASIVLADQTATIDRVEALRDAADALDQVVIEIEADADADITLVATLSVQVEALFEEQKVLIDATEGEAAAIAQAIADIQERKSDLADTLNLSGAGGGSIGALLSDVQAGQVPPTGPFLALPLADTTFGSGFGPRVHPIFSDTRLHTGIDMSGSAGASILSSADGVVVLAEEVSGYGNVVVVDHGNTVATLYAHMTADAVFVGQQVVQGELLGFVGSTGYSTGPHLHYEVRLLGQPVDPMPYIDFSAG